jgi:hypothetical protein
MPKIQIRGIDRTKLRRKLAAVTGCTVQHDGWPCGSCFPWGGAHWRAILAYRGDYDKNVDLDKGVATMCVDIEYNDDGSFKRHIMADIQLDDIKAKVKEVWEAVNV